MTASASVEKGGVPARAPLVLVVEDEAEVRWLAAALAHSPGGAHWVALATAKDGIIRRAARAVAKP